ncbi:MAG TPA: QueT transporter family protein [Anaerovoracaceae bacterium]|nr:QueT transporter family protein [Anaerovoracaceae bacterium]
MKTKFLIQAGIIAATYAALTIVLAPFSYGPMQIRVSEALTILPYFTPAAVPGLFIGCLVSNYISPYGVIDMICGSGATLIAAAGSYMLRSKPVLVPLPPVLANAVIIGLMLYYAYGVPMNLFLIMAWIGLGELIACYAIGYPLLRYLKKYKRIFE